MLHKGRRARAKIQDHIVDRAARALNDLRLFVWRQLVMHPAHRALTFVEGDAALGQQRVQPPLLHFPSAPRARKEAALIFQPFDVDEKRPGDPSLAKDHSYTFTSGMGTRNF